MSGVDTKSNKILTLKKDFYVSPQFAGDSSSYKYTNNMVYQKFQAYLCQLKGGENEDQATSTEPDEHGLDRELLSSIYPLCSKGWLMFYGIKDNYNDRSIISYEVVLLPEYNSPQIIHLDPNDYSSCKMEYFFYHDNNYIIYHMQGYGSKAVTLMVYK